MSMPLPSADDPIQNRNAHSAGTHADEVTPPSRSVIVVDAALPPGRAANAAAVLALTLGKRHPQLGGADMTNADGDLHHGLVWTGISVLCASADMLTHLRDRAIATGVEVIDFPTEGQQTTDYEAFRRAVSLVPRSELRLVGLCLHGAKKAVTRLVGSLPLLR